MQDLAAPRLLHAFVPEFSAEGFAWSSAVHDHLAFNYFASAGVLTIPVQYSASSVEEHFSGFAAFAVDPAAGFTELGRVDHSDLARSTHCDGSAGSPPACGDGTYLEAANPRRAVAGAFAGDTFIYTLSDVAMKVGRAEELSQSVAVLPLEYPNDYWWAF